MRLRYCGDSQQRWRRGTFDLGWFCFTCDWSAVLKVHFTNAPAHVLYLAPQDFLRGSPLDRGFIGEHRGTGKSGNAGCSQQVAVESRERVLLSSLQQGTVWPSIGTQPFTLYGDIDGGNLPLTVSASLGSEGEGGSWIWVVAGAWGWGRHGCRQIFPTHPRHLTRLRGIALLQNSPPAPSLHQLTPKTCLPYQSLTGYEPVREQFHGVKGNKQQGHRVWRIGAGEKRKRNQFTFLSSAWGSGIGNLPRYKSLPSSHWCQAPPYKVTGKDE